MSDLPRFTDEENLRRIKMDENSTYVLVEGEDDVPIFENALSALLQKPPIEFELVFVHGGGKGKIKPFIERESPKKCFVIFDKDFDYDFDISYGRNKFLLLSKYSIENHMFNENCVIPMIAIISRLSARSVTPYINIGPWRKDVNEKLTGLAKVLFYYQKKYDGRREVWTDFFILENGADKWAISSERVQDLLGRLVPHGTENEEIEEFFLDNFETSRCLSETFPGKMLFVSFYRYIYTLVEQIKEKAFRRNFSNFDSFKNSLSLNLVFNNDFKRDMGPLLQFIGA